MLLTLKGDRLLNRPDSSRLAPLRLFFGSLVLGIVVTALHQLDQLGKVRPYPGSTSHSTNKKVSHGQGRVRRAPRTNRQRLTTPRNLR
jgi:hypothetical protein